MKTMDNQQWVETQFGSCRLGNTKRTERLVKVASAMLAQPEQSLPKQNVLWKELKAAYRLFDQDQVTFDAVAEIHWEKTRQTKPGRYLLISDTTDVDHFSHRATTGLGPLGSGSGRGMHLHSCLVYNCNAKQIEGMAGALLQYRTKVPKKETRMQRLDRKRESQLWGDLVEKVGKAPEGCQWIHVFDRGGDNFEAMCHIRLERCDWIIRVAKFQRNVIDSTGATVAFREAVGRTQLLGSYELNLRSRPGVKARTAKINVSVCSVTFPRPRHHSAWVKKCGITELKMNVVIVQEVGTCTGATPIRWVLMTSLPVTTLSQAWQVIEDYENRWLIEEYHKALKTGCSIELHSLRTAERLEPLIGLIGVLGIRLFQMKLLGRSQPDIKAATHIPSCWLKALKLIRPTVKITELSVYEFFRELAKLGGFLARKGDGEPGWQTIWHGYKKIHAILDALRLTGHI